MSKADYHKAYKRQYYKLNKSLSVTISNEDYDALKARADELDSKPIPLLRDMAFAVLYDQSFVPELVENELKELRFLILNIANNVNQMAHHSNTVRSLVDEKGPSRAGELSASTVLVDSQCRSANAPGLGEPIKKLRELRRLEESINDYTHDRLKKVTHDH